MKIRIPIYQPSLTGNERKYVNDCLDSNWISSKGKYVKQFESSFASYHGTGYAASVCNGTAALHLALLALGIRQGDEVLVPTLTYVASVNAISYTGATPVFVDSLPETWQVDPRDIEARITPRTKAIVAVHLYGHPCDMDYLMDIAKSHNLFLVEDCAEAFGSRFKGNLVGTFGDISTFSFFGNKTITTGEGGMIFTKDLTMYQRCVHFKCQGLADHREYWHDVVGYNYRMTNICAAIGLAQLEQSDTFIAKKRLIAKWYQDGLADLPLQIHSEAQDCFHSYWMTNILLDCPEYRDTLRTYLSENGIETRPLFYPVHTMPMYSDNFQRYPGAENIGWRGITIPSWPGLEKSEVDEICSCVNRFFLHIQ